MRRLRVSGHVDASRLHLQLGRQRKPTGPQGPFYRKLASELEGARLKDLRQVRADRIVELDFAETPSGERRALLCELTGRHANLVLLGPQDRVLDLLVSAPKGREARLVVGQPWAPPPGSGGRPSELPSVTEALPELRVGLVHGRMRPVEKERGMQAFKEGLIQVLVATTVIEVGVDVPNASLMIIENAERMGLSQLHQLRGRVGRGAAQSHCVLLYKPPLGRIAKERLAVLRDTNDGFVVAQRDLELRGPGELLGTRQTGLPDYRVANLVRDAELMPQVQITAEAIRKSSADRAAAIVRRWLGDAGRYGKV